MVGQPGGKVDAQSGMPGEGAPSVALGIWETGALRVDESTASVSHAGVALRLDRSSYDVLLVLLRRRGEVVTKDELLEAGWPGRVVSENSLAKAVSRLRHVLGEDAAHLRAVHGYGYRFTGPVAFRPVPGPAAGLAVAYPVSGAPVPYRPGWTLGARLAEGASGLVFEALHPNEAPRAVKFALGERGLLEIKREAALLRYVARTAGSGDSPVFPLLGSNLSNAPFFIELPLHPDGHLGRWLARPGAQGEVRPLDERLRAASVICMAVARLHDLGVVHRDLKPENLYLFDQPGTASGLHAVIGDLGTSDAVASASLASLGVTLSLLHATDATAAGSLLYVSPEVIGGGAATQHSDVYALGVLVYQLALGNLRRPLGPGWEDDIDDPLLREDIALAAQVNPARRAIDARGLAERIEQLPRRRLQRTQALEEAAAAQRNRDELARWKRRRVRGVIATAVLLAGLGLALWQQQRTEQARLLAEAAAQRARIESDKANAVVRFMTRDVLSQADPFAAGGGAPDLSLRDAIDRAAARVDTRFAGHPRAAAAVHGTLGATYTGLNQFDAAVRHRTRQVALSRADGDPAALVDALQGLCVALTWLGDVVRARPACTQAVSVAADSGRTANTASAFLGLLHTREGEANRALVLLEPLIERLRGRGELETLADALWFAAVAHSQLGDVVRAERAQRERLAARRRLDGPSVVSMAQAWALSDHGGALLALGRQAEGEAQLRRARDAFVDRAGPAHPHAWVPEIRRARHLAAQHRWREALAIARPAFDSLHPQVGPQNWTLHAAAIAMQAHAHLGEGAAARALAKVLEPITREPGSRYLYDDMASALASAQATLGDTASARRWVALLESLPDAPGDVSRTLPARIACHRAEIAYAEADRPAAIALAERCRTGLAATLPPGHPLHAWPRRLHALAD